MRRLRLDATDLIAVYATLVAVFVAYVSWITLREHFATPWADDWRFLDALFSGSLRYFAPYNGHRQPISLALLVLDYRWLGGHMHLLTGAGLVCVWTAAAAFTLAWGPAALGSPAFVFAVFALFWAAAYFDLPWGMQQPNTQSVMWLAVALAALAVDQRRRAQGGGGAGAMLIVAGLAAVAATFSFGNGISTFAALVIVALVARLPMRVLAGYVLLGLVTGVSYSIGLEHAHGGAYLRLDSGLLRAVAIATSFVGSAVGTALAPLAGLDMEGRWRVSIAAGVAGVGVGLGRSVLLLRRRQPLTGNEVLGIGLMTFSAVTGTLIALGRSTYWNVGIDSRFTTSTSLFWIGLVAATVDTRRGALATVALLLVSLAMLPAFRAGRSEQARIHEILDLTAALHLLDLRADAETRGTLVQKSPEQVYRVIDRLRADGRSMFGEPRAALAGSPLDAHFRVDPNAQCRGTARPTPLVTRGRTGFRLGGHAFDPEAPPTSIVVTDPQGIIRGLGAFTPLMHARFAAAERRTDGIPYRGFVADRDPTLRYTVWAVRADGRSVCRIATVRAGSAAK